MEKLLYTYFWKRLPIVIRAWPLAAQITKNQTQRKWKKYKSSSFFLCSERKFSVIFFIPRTPQVNWAPKQQTCATLPSDVASFSTASPALAVRIRAKHLFCPAKRTRQYSMASLEHKLILGVGMGFLNIPSWKPQHSSEADRVLESPWGVSRKTSQVRIFPNPSPGEKVRRCPDILSGVWDHCCDLLTCCCPCPTPVNISAVVMVMSFLVYLKFSAVLWNRCISF